MESRRSQKGASESPLIQADREKCRDFKEFLKLVWPLIEGGRPLKWNWHIEVFCDHLQALHEGRLGNKLIVNVPPRTSKSTVVTIAFPCWVWTQNPNLSFVFASYSFPLSSDHAYKRRLILESDWYKDRWWRGIDLAGDRSSLVAIENTARGGMYTTSISGSATGKGGDYRILDDPNNATEMESETQRDTVLRFVDVTWPTRVNDPVTEKQIIVQQRTHTKDVTGHSVKKWNQGRMPYTHLVIPAEFNPEKRCVTPIWTDHRTAKGELIDGVRFPQSYLDEKKIDLGPYFYAGQFDQEPYPLGGGIFKESWIRCRWRASEKQPGHMSVLNGQYHFDPATCYRICTVDPAISEETSGEKKLTDPDYTVIMSWVVVFTHLGSVACLMEMYRRRMEGPEIIPFIQELHKRSRFAVIGVETVAFQKMLFQEAKKKGLPVREISTKNSDDVIYRIDRDKISRAMAATPFLSQGRLAVPETAPWLSEFEAELLQFPNAAHDDITDCLVYGIAIAEKYKGNPLHQNDEPREERNSNDRRGDAPENPLERWESSGGLSGWESPL